MVILQISYSKKALSGLFLLDDITTSLWNCITYLTDNTRNRLFVQRFNNGNKKKHTR